MRKFETKTGQWSEKNWFIFIYCLLLSFLFLLICTKSSPLFPFNDWVDTNASFTMGKAMINGKVLYRDIFDQRGPWLYFLFGLGYLVSNTTFTGIFLIEVFSFSIFLFYCFKSISLFLDKNYAAIGITIIASLVPNFKSFIHGGSPEEFCLPLLAISLYYLLRYFVEIYPAKIPGQWVILNGVIAGIVLWIKYSVLGFWVGWLGVVLLDLALQKEFVQTIQYAAIFIVGVLTAAIPWVAYFGLTDSIYEWIHSYFIINLTNYSDSLSTLSWFVNLIWGPFGLRLENSLQVVLIVLGLLVFLLNKRYLVNSRQRWSLLLCYLLLNLGIFGSGIIRTYYAFVLAPFLIFGVISYLKLFSTALRSHRRIGSTGSSIVVMLLILSVTLPFTFFFNHNAYMRDISKKDLVQYKYAKIINETDDATLLNYGWLDVGLYTTTGIVPNVRFFQNQNISYLKFPLIMDEQNRYIREKTVEYVIYPVREDKFPDEVDVPFLDKNYHLIRDDIQQYEGVDFHYLLFKKND